MKSKKVSAFFINNNITQVDLIQVKLRVKYSVNAGKK